MTSLPTPLPENPLPLLRLWFDEAQAARATANPNAMVLATVDVSVTPPQPSARVVLCKQLNEHDGFIVFFTNYQSRKGQELSRSQAASAVFHWDDAERQVRVEGEVVRSPDSESDAYFQSRHPGSRVGAWASAQSKPVASRAQLLEQVREQAARFGVPLRDGLEAQRVDADIPRPAHWGGYRLWIKTIELWCGGTHRVHDRCAWQRELVLTSNGTASNVSAWRHTRLQP